VLRSCYRVLMRFRSGDEPQEVRWYFCADDAQIFKGPSAFRSWNHESDPKENDALGEQRPGYRPWSNGVRPAGFSGRSGLGCTPPLWFEQGLPDGVRIRVPKSTSGVPLCCLPLAGGLAFGGVADVTPRVPRSKPGGIAFSGTASTEFRILPGGIMFAGEADVVFHPPVAQQLCCPTFFGPGLATLSIPFTCPDLDGVALPLVWDGVGAYTGAGLTNLGRAISISLECHGLTVGNWTLTLTIASYVWVANTLVEPGGTCAPLNLVFHPVGLVSPAGCFGFLTVTVTG